MNPSIRKLALIPISLPLLVSGCQRAQSTLYPAGPAANRLAHLSWFMIVLFSVIIVVMWVLIVLPLRRRKGSFDEHAPVDVGGGQAWIAIGGFAVPLVVLTIIFVLGLTAMSKFPVHDGGAAELKPQIRLIGHQWWWEVAYLEGGPSQQFNTANEIHVPVGRPVDIELISRDVIHSFWVPALHGKVDLVPGISNYIRIQADHAGTFRGQCAEYCGAQHAHMGIIVVAQQPDEYNAWAEQQRQPAATPSGEEAARGAQLFQGAPCANCHRIRGTLAAGSVAPDLTHIAGRHGIAANTFPNDMAHLEAWITHAQSLKPAVAMPDITQFNGRDLRALVSYLQQLK